MIQELRPKVALFTQNSGAYWHHIFNVGLQPGLIASDEATNLWQRTKESFRVQLFLDHHHKGFGREDHRMFCRLFKLQFRAKEHKTFVWVMLHKYWLCEKNGCSQKFDVPISRFLQKNKLRTLGYDNIDLKTKLIFVVLYGWTFAPSCWSFRKHQRPKREPRVGSANKNECWEIKEMTLRGLFWLRQEQHKIELHKTQKIKLGKGANYQTMKTSMTQDTKTE